MANNIIRRTWKQSGLVNIEDLRGSAFQAEQGSHTFLISGVDENGEALALSGTPAGVLLRSDGQDVALTCSVSDGIVSATLPANAYVVPGRVGITIFLTNNGQKVAIYAAVGSVATTSSGTVAPPAGSDVVDLVNAIATAVATIPASYTDLMAAVAPTYSTSALYAVGSYAWYDGKLYRCTTAITSGETWTSGHWTLANLGSDVSDLKSAVSDLEETVFKSKTDTFSKSLTTTSGSRISDGLSGQNTWVPLSGVSAGDTVKFKVTCSDTSIISSYTFRFGDSSFNAASSGVNNCVIGTEYTATVPSGYTAYARFYTSTATSSGKTVKFSVTHTIEHSDSMEEKIENIENDIEEIKPIVYAESETVSQKTVVSTSGSRVADGTGSQKTRVSTSDFSVGDTLLVCVECDDADIISSYTGYWSTSGYSDTSAVINNCVIGAYYKVTVPDSEYKANFAFYTSVASASGKNVAFKVIKLTENSNSLPIRINASANLAEKAYSRVMLTDRNGWANEGACTDGTYIYYIRSDNFTTYELCKYNINTGELSVTEYTGSVDLGHGNDMTYNPLTEKIYILPMKSGNVYEFTTSFEYTATKTVLNSNWSKICYSRSKNKYIIGYNESVLYLLNSNFTIDSIIPIKVFPTLSTYMVSQGMECDENYLYCLYNIKSDSTHTTGNIVYVYDYSGNFIKTISIDLAAEGETLCNAWDGHIMYLFCNSTANRLHFIALNDGMTFQQYEKYQALFEG